MKAGNVCGKGVLEREFGEECVLDMLVGEAVCRVRGAEGAFGERGVRKGTFGKSVCRGMFLKGNVLGKGVGCDVRRGNGLKSVLGGGYVWEGCKGMLMWRTRRGKVGEFAGCCVNNYVNVCGRK